MAEIHVFFGLIASGKSYLGKSWAEKKGMRYHNSDVVRKELAGLAPTARRGGGLEQGIYTPEFTRRTYDALLERGAADLAAGRSVVLDASYQSVEERERVRELAKRCGAKLRFILCSCPEAVVKERLALRAKDPAAVSDGHWEIYEAQRARYKAPEDLPADELITISTDAPVEELLQSLENKLRSTP